MPRADFENAIDKYGDYEIEKLRVIRRPLYGGLTEVAQKFAAKKGAVVHDKYFHLWTEFALKDPVTGKRTVLLTEKNQTLNAVENRPGGLDDLHLGAGQEGMNIDLPDPSVKKIHLGEYFGASKAFHEANGENFNRYSIKYGNCQHHTRNSLAANGLMSDEVDAFVNAKAEEIVPKWASRVGNLFTDAAAFVDNSKDRIREAVAKVRYGSSPPDLMAQHREEAYLRADRSTEVSPLPIPTT